MVMKWKDGSERGWWCSSNSRVVVIIVGGDDVVIVVDGDGVVEFVLKNKKLFRKNTSSDKCIITYMEKMK